MADPLKLTTLLVDDEKNIRQTLSVSLRGLGCEVVTATSAEEALTRLKPGAFDFVLTDFKLEGQSGLALVQAARKLKPEPVVVIMTAFASFENAVNAIKEGAFDYLPKPFSNAQLAHVLQKVRLLAALKRENEELRARATRPDFFAGMTSPAIARLEEFVDKVADTDATVLMVGESGTGKSELARVIHERSKRRQHPFVTVSCTTLAETLLESELFGHVRGAFTGATQDHVGRFEFARLGTVFLDEIGELSPTGQTKLLRVLQERVVERVGGNRPIPIDVRVIAATNRNLEEEVRSGKFREDLFYRLNVFECSLVPLRNRREDLPVLIERFHREFSALAGESVPRPIPEPVRKLLLAHAWPGNVRELRNAIERLVLLSRGREMTSDDLPNSVRLPPSKRADGRAPDDLRTLEALEREHIERVLGLTHGQEEAAKALGITTVTLWRKRKEYGLP